MVELIEAGLCRIPFILFLFLSLKTKLVHDSSFLLKAAFFARRDANPESSDLSAAHSCASLLVTLRFPASIQERLHDEASAHHEILVVGTSFVA
jgi:hypothetical protein